MIYKNTSHLVKTFNNVQFKPHEVKEVNFYINDPKLIILSSLPKTSKKHETSVKSTKTDLTSTSKEGSD